MEKGTVKDNVPRGDPRNVLHEKMLEEIIEEGNETVTNCNRLKMKASDGKILQYLIRKAGTLQ